MVFIICKHAVQCAKWCNYLAGSILPLPDSRKKGKVKSSDPSRRPIKANLTFLNLNLKIFIMSDIISEILVKYLL